MAKDSDTRKNDNPKNKFHPFKYNHIKLLRQEILRIYRNISKTRDEVSLNPNLYIMRFVFSL